MASCCVIVKTYKDGRRELDDVPVPDDVVRVEPEGSDVQKMFRFVCLKQNKNLKLLLAHFPLEDFVPIVCACANQAFGIRNFFL